MRATGSHWYAVSISPSGCPFRYTRRKSRTLQTYTNFTIAIYRNIPTCILLYTILRYQNKYYKQTKRKNLRNHNHAFRCIHFHVVDGTSERDTCYYQTFTMWWKSRSERRQWQWRRRQFPPASLVSVFFDSIGAWRTPKIVWSEIWMNAMYTYITTM